MTLAPAARHAATDDESNALDESTDQEPTGDGAEPSPSPLRRSGRTGPVLGASVGAVIVGAVLVAVLLLGAVVGGFVFLNTKPVVRPPAVDLSPDDVASAQESVSSAKMMIDMMAATVDSSTAGIDKVVSAVEPTFASIGTASDAADQMAAGLADAPDLTAAAAKVSELGGTVSRSLTQAQSLASSARNIDELITPLVSGLTRSDVPGADKTIAQLKSVQKASRAIAAQLGDLGALRGELDRATAAVGPAAQQIDGAIAQARSAATQLTTGLDRLSSAKGDTERAADSLSEGIDQLKKALAAVSNNLLSADDSLTSDDAAPAYVYDHANRVGRAVTSGAVTALGVLVVGGGAYGVLRRRRRRAAA